MLRHLGWVDWREGKRHKVMARPDGTRRTVILTHHLRKKTGTPGANSLRDRVAGSFRFIGAMDQVSVFVPAGSQAFTVRMVKPSRWGIHFRPFLVCIEGHPPGPLTLISSGAIDELPTERTAEEERFIAALSGMTGPDGWVKLRGLKKAAGVDPKDRGSVKRFERAGRRLAKTEAVEVREKPVSYRITGSPVEPDEGPE